MKKAPFSNIFNAPVCQRNIREQSLNVENVYTLFRQTCIGNVMIYNFHTINIQPEYLSLPFFFVFFLLYYDFRLRIDKGL